MKKKVMLGMSGGVDSSAAALLLLRQGYDVTGVTMRLIPGRLLQNNPENGGPADETDDARRVCRFLGIGHQVLELSDAFEKNVICGFSQQYQSGLTPNPCIACNRYIKFGAMLRYALQLGFDSIATGHYALIEPNARGRYLLKKSPSAKDQSYVLYMLKQEQLSRVLLPIGEYSKPEIRQLAREAGLPVAEKRDSQEICFVKDNDYASFLERYTGEKPEPGDFVDESGNVIGNHRGITHYTVGQRKGLGVSFGKPMYVTGIDAGRNRVLLGEEGRQYSSSLTAGDLNFIPFDRLTGEMDVEVKVRYSAKPAKAKLTPLENDTARVEFETPQRAVTPGQAVVFYDGDIVVGGGSILPESS